MPPWAIRPLGLEEVCNNYAADYHAAFLDSGVSDCQTMKEARDASLLTPIEGAGRLQAAVGAAAATALGLGVDLAEREIRREASRYEASYRVEAAFEGFYERVYYKDDGNAISLCEPETTPCSGSEAALRQSHFGFEIRRATKDSNDAYKAVFGIHLNTGNRLLRIAPLTFQTQKAKTKVLSTRGWTFLWGWALNAGDALDTDTRVELVGIHVTYDGAVKTVSLGPPIRLHLPEYDLSGASLLRRSGAGDSYLQQCPATIDADEDPPETAPVCFAGFAAPVPVSVDADERPTGNGAYYIKAVVTERDPSNAREALLGLAKQVREQGDAAVKKLEEELKEEEGGDDGGGAEDDPE